MASLNRFRQYIDNSSNEGVKLYNSALYDFKNPLDSDKKLSLTPKDAASFVNIVNRLSNQFGYDFMIQNIPTTRTITPGADPAVDPDIITFGGHRNLLESYSPNNIEFTRKYASLNWGDKSYTLQTPQTLDPLTVADGDLTNRGALTEQGKIAMRDRMHSKFMAYQILELLTEAARKSIELNKQLYTWKSADGREVEMDGHNSLSWSFAGSCGID